MHALTNGSRYTVRTHPVHSAVCSGNWKPIISHNVCPPLTSSRPALPLTTVTILVCPRPAEVVQVNPTTRCRRAQARPGILLDSLYLELRLLTRHRHCLSLIDWLTHARPAPVQTSEQFRAGSPELRGFPRNHRLTGGCWLMVRPGVGNDPVMN